MAIKVDQEKFDMLKQGKTICIDGKHPLRKVKTFESPVGEITKGYCSSWWGNGAGYSSSFDKPKEDEK